MKVYSQLIKARFEQVTTDLTENIKGLFWQNTTTNKLKYHDGTQAREVVDTDSAQVLFGKTLAAPVVNSAQINTPVVNGGTLTGSVINTATISEATINSSALNDAVLNSPIVDFPMFQGTTQSPPLPSVGSTKLYFKPDGKAYTLDSDGKERRFGKGGGGSSLVWDKNTALPPSDVSQDGIKLEGFDYAESQDISLVVNVPATYEAGVPIKLIGGSFCTSVTAGAVHFKTESALLRPGSTVLGVYSNVHSSINTGVAASAIANQITSTGEIDLTDSTGKINNILVAAGDKLKVKLFRSISTESPSAQDIAKLLVNNFEITFTN